MSRSLRSPAMLAALVPWLTIANEAGAEEPAQDITVTGERLKRPLSIEPSSVVVMTDDTLESTPGADRLDQVLGLVANVQLGSGGEGPTIRGQDSTGPLRDLPAFLGGNRARVTLQVDGRPISYNELAFGVAGLWDVERIEIFRSPQTTSRGRNSIAGAIFIETGNPSFDWQARARLTRGEARTRQASAVLSGPIVSGQLAFRIAGDVRRSRTSSRITPTALDADYNRDDYEVIRLKLLATPTAVPGLRLLATATHNRSSAPQIEGVRAPFNDRRDPVATYGLFRIRVDAATFQADYDFSADWQATATLTLGDATIRRLAPTGFGEAYIAAGDSSLEGVLRWHPQPGRTLLVGLNRARAKLDQQIDLSSALLGQGVFADQQVSLGLFGQADWHVTPRLAVTAGLRYQVDLQERTGLLGIGNGDPLSLHYRQRYSRLLPKLTASFELRPGLRIGAQVQRAYNPGGVTLDALRRVPDTFGPETLWAYEIFARIFPRNRRVSVSANAFYYDVKDAQRTVQREIHSPAGVVTIAEIDNAPAARSYGAEMQMEWRPSPRLTVTAAAGVLRTRLTRTLSPADPLLGREFQRSPHFTSALGAVWHPFSKLRFSLQARRNSGYFSDDANTLSRRVAGATVADAGATWTTGAIELSVYARNVLDEFYLTYLFSPTARLATAGDPREIGATASVRF